MNNKVAVLIYPQFSMQEISCLTAALALWYETKIDIFASTANSILTEDGFTVIPSKTLDQFCAEDYSCVILPGTINPLPALHDEQLIQFLRQLEKTNLVIAAISCAPLLLAKAGLLDNVSYTAGIWDEIARYFSFVPYENNIHQPVVHDQNIVTAIGFAFREFAVATIKAIGFDCEEHLFTPVSRNYTPDELTYYMGESAFKDFLDELNPYTAQEKSL